MLCRHHKEELCAGYIHGLKIHPEKQKSALRNLNLQAQGCTLGPGSALTTASLCWLAWWHCPPFSSPQPPLATPGFSSLELAKVKKKCQLTWSLNRSSWCGRPLQSKFWPLKTFHCLKFSMVLISHHIYILSSCTFSLRKVIFLSKFGFLYIASLNILYLERNIFLGPLTTFIKVFPLLPTWLCKIHVYWFPI